jgi:hypothetical protein
VRLAACFLFALAGLAAGCRKPAPPPAVEPVPAEAPEVWKLVKVELPIAGGTCVEESVGVEVEFLKRARRAEPGGPVRLEDIPPQPAEFSHEHHTVQLGIDCRYCHTVGVNRGGVAGTARVCMNCHQHLRPGADPRGLDANVLAAGKGKRWSFVVERDVTKTPKEIDATECDADGWPTPGRVVRRGIYEEDGDGLRIALAFGGVPKDFRPKEFAPTSLPGFAGVAVFHLKK